MNACGIIETGLNYNKSSPRKVIATIESHSVTDNTENLNSGNLLKKKLSTPVLPSQKVLLSSRSNSDLGVKNLKSFPLHKSKSLESNKSHERYSRLCESRSVTPSPPPPQVPLLSVQKTTLEFDSVIEDNTDIMNGNPGKTERPKLLNIPGLLFIGKKVKGKIEHFHDSVVIFLNLLL